MAVHATELNVQSPGKALTTFEGDLRKFSMLPNCPHLLAPTLSWLVFAEQPGASMRVFFMQAFPYTPKTLASMIQVACVHAHATPHACVSMPQRMHVHTQCSLTAGLTPACLQHFPSLWQEFDGDREHGSTTRRVADILRTMLPVALAVDALQCAGLVHMGICPEEVLLYPGEGCKSLLTHSLGSCTLLASMLALPCGIAACVHHATEAAAKWCYFCSHRGYMQLDTGPTLTGRHHSAMVRCILTLMWFLRFLTHLFVLVSADGAVRLAGAERAQRIGTSVHVGSYEHMSDNQPLMCPSDMLWSRFMRAHPAQDRWEGGFPMCVV